MTLETRLSAEYRRLMRWYPKHWRLANEEAMLGALLDQAEAEGRGEPSSAERSAIKRAGLAHRLGFAARSQSPLTLLLGGSGIVLATLVPLIGRGVFLFPVPYALSWLNDSWQALPQELSAMVLVLAFGTLAVGVRGESGIAAKSILGKVALILLAFASLAISILDSGPAPTLGTSPTVIAWIAVASWTFTLLELAALIVAAIVVFRAGVVLGLARWGLVVLAIVLVLTLALGYIPVRAVGAVVVFGYPVALLIQLLIGVVFIVNGRHGPVKSPPPVGAAQT